LYPTFEENDQLFTLIEVEMNDRLDNVAYQLFGSENFADILLAVNDENFLWGTPFDQEIVLTQTENFVRIFHEQMKIDEQTVDYAAFKDNLYQLFDERNSKKKIWKVPRQENLGEVINLVENYKRSYTNVTKDIDDYEGSI